MNDSSSDLKNSPSTQRKDTPQKKRPKEEQKRKSQHDSSRKKIDPPTSTGATSFEQLLQTAFQQSGVDQESTKKFMSDIAPRGKEVCCTLSQNTDLLKETLKFCGITNPLEQASIITALKREYPFNSNQESFESKLVGIKNFEPSTSPLRLASNLEDTTKQFGPLTDLIGTWVGTKGWNLIAVPNQKGGFILEVVPYFETIVISPLSTPTPNRGKKIIQEVPTLMYSLSIHSSIDQSLLHRENGTWLLLPDCPSNFQLARQASIPHGTSVVALGNASPPIPGPPVIHDITSLPVVPHAPLGYFEQYTLKNPVGPFDKKNPNKVLQDDIKGQKIISTTTLDIASANQGIIGSIPFVTQNANASKFEAIFWIETVVNDQGNKFLQLQYSQKTLLSFIHQFGDPDPNKLIEWPHINVNTLVKE